MPTTETLETTLPQKSTGGHPSAWLYREAFKRNYGIITLEEQQILRNSRVAIAGMGGVGGLHLTTLARMGVGKFIIADPDVFEIANFNRQNGATVSNLGRNKAVVMAEMARDINPEIEIEVFSEAIDENNLQSFLDAADVYVDGIDLYAIEVRRKIFRACAERNIWALTAGPMGCSTGWVLFDPQRMSFDRYFDLSDELSELEKLIAFIVGLCPRALHLSHLDTNCVRPEERSAPSVSAGCQLATGVMGTLVMKVLLGRGERLPAPYFHQFDAYRQKLVKAKLRGGNRHPLQRLKRWWLKRLWNDRFSGSHD